MKLRCPTCGSEVEPRDVVFDGQAIVPNERLDEIAAKIGSDSFRVPTENDREALPLVDRDRFEHWLREQTDLLEVHTSEYWQSPSFRFWSL